MFLPQVNHLINYWNVTMSHFFEWASSSNTGDGDSHKTSVVTGRLFGQTWQVEFTLYKWATQPIWMGSRSQTSSVIPNYQRFPSKSNPVLMVRKQETQTHVRAETITSTVDTFELVKSFFGPLGKGRDVFTSREQAWQVLANITGAAMINQHNKLRWLHQFLEAKIDVLTLNVVIETR